jgi:hypothetical protein
VGRRSGFEHQVGLAGFFPLTPALSPRERIHGPKKAANRAPEPDSLGVRLALACSVTA